MPHLETLIPRPALFNAALYAASALVYTVVLFILDSQSPGTYVFQLETKLRDHFYHLAICSWPILLFGALMLVAVRIGAKVRRSRRARRRRRAAKKRKASASGKVRPPVPSTVPPSPGGVLQRGESGAEGAHEGRRQKREKKREKRGRHGELRQQQQQQQQQQQGQQRMEREGVSADAAAELARKKSSKASKISKGSKSSRNSRKNRVPRGYVSVTRSQRVFAALGFLWVAVGVACTSTCGGLVFAGQRERYVDAASGLGVEASVWKQWIIPAVTGGIPALVYAIMTLTTLMKFYGTLAAKGRQVDTPTTSVVNDEEAGMSDLVPLDEVEVVFEQPGTEALTRAGARKEQRDLGYVPAANGERPDDRTVERLMRQLRDMGFRNPQRNMAALQAASFDLATASDKLANTEL